MITQKDSKKFAEEVLKKNLSELMAEYLLLHSEFVIKAANELAKEKGIKIDEKIFEIAGYLHDIGYSINEKNHAEESLKLTKERFPEIDKISSDCILNHSSNNKPITKEGKIFQMADKLAAFYPKFIINLIELEKKEGKLNEKEIIEKHKKKLEKYLHLFDDKEFKKVTNKYFQEFLDNIFK